MVMQVFKNEEFGEIRTMEVNGEPWFVGKDVAEILGYTNTQKAIRDHIDAEDKLTERIVLSGQKRQMYIINESGLYSLILSSKLPSAKKFKRWVTSEVLPAIRKHGTYATEELLNDPELAIKAFTALKEEREKNKQLLADNERMKPKEIFADSVATSKTSCLVGELAKILKQNGIDIGQNRLFKWLREHGYLMHGNTPTQRSMNQGLFEIKVGTYINSNGSSVTTTTTKVTGKGQIYFINKFLVGNKGDKRKWAN